MQLPNLNDVNAELARREMLEYCRLLWQSKSNKPYQVGRHTIGICEEIDKALADFERGQPSFIILTVPPQHGKSEIVSRFLPTYFLGKHPDDEVMVVSYAADLAYGFSRNARKLMRSAEYAATFPAVKIAQDNAGVEEWGIEGRTGKARFSGIGGGVTGKGAALAVIDDPIAKREEAESETIRNKVWDSFRNDVMSRLAPVSVVIVTMTRWHNDDLVGRILKEMKENPDFPRFKVLDWPATRPGEYDWLFTERYSPAFYENQRALQGSYGWSSLYLCNPVPRTGNIIRADKVKILSPEKFDEVTRGMRFARGWDLASGEARVKEDPDWTSGCKAAKAWTRTNDPQFKVPVLFIADYIRGRWEALERNRRIMSTAIADGTITVGVEKFGAYKDAYTTVKTILGGIRSVRPVQLPGDKVAKAETVSPMFEAGNVYMRKAPWNDEVLAQYAAFPGAAHDDDVDAVTVVNDVLDKRTDWS
jgi:predicted phage terminase large subunit-like protein